MGDRSTRDFEGENGRTTAAKLSVDGLLALNESVSSLLSVTVQVGVIFLASWLVLRGELTAGAIIGLTQVSGQIISPIQQISENLPRLQGAKPVIDRLLTLADYRDTGFTGTGEPGFQQQISLEDVTFRYDGGLEAASGLTASFRRGKKYAVVGKSGCGKTTMASLMTGQYPGYTGEITYDGRELRDLDIRAVEALSAIIHQNTYMFDASIRDNICLHNPIPEDELQRALHMSGVDTFLDGERDLDSPVGENGAKLSGGQRQRIAVARALVQKKPLLILDEGTSAVDRQTAYDIERRLLQSEDLTLITITHALDGELLGAYDEILYMEDGAVRERGSFDTLTAAGGGFYRFCQIKQVG